MPRGLRAEILSQAVGWPIGSSHGRSGRTTSGCYNAYDLDSFLSCFADNAIVAGPDGSVQMTGRDQMRAQFGVMFERRDVQAEILERVRAGNWVVDHERVTRPGRSMDVLVAYEVIGDSITRMITLR